MRKRRTSRDKTRGITLIRRARASDASALAALTGQLGYDVTPKQIAIALKQIAKIKLNELFVAQDSGGNLAGWIQLFDEIGIAGGHRAEVAGLVVDASCRGAGVGRQLMEFAERWAKKRGCRSVYLRTNVTRAAAHIFYERIGYEHIKTQKAYRKTL